MAGTTVAILDAEPVAVDISVELTVDQRFLAEVAVSQVAQAVAALLDFDTVDFGHTLYQSDVYAAAESVEGVLGATVTRFQRADRPAPDLEAELARHQLPPMAQLPAFLRDAVAAGVAPEGRIDVGEFEIPTAGVLDVRLKPAG